MIFHAFGIHNRAVWNALQLHAHLLSQSGEQIVFLVHEKHQQIVQHSFPEYPILTYRGYVDFLKMIIASDQKSIFTSTFTDTLRSIPALLFKKLRIYYWVQGIEAEESYMRNGSRIRKQIISILEKISLYFSTYQILVSPYMKTYLEAKHHSHLDNSIIIPCTSDLHYNGSPKIKDSFTYVGGMAVWQRFDVMLDMFNHIAQERPNAHFYVATGGIEHAKSLIATHLHSDYHNRISIRSIDSRSEMEEFLSTIEYGFLIRDDDPVNNVSSPIKLAEYLSCGVNVIISDVVTSYAPMVESYGAGIRIHGSNDIKQMRMISCSPKNALDMYNDHFDAESLVEKYRSIL
ncbi:hypothetical protein [Sulfuricurvum sp.]|uniref:hypothetical protein n=1 Tax=Sulfuricurvum sp. TaxID=2025608 RepID=UPI00260D6360|nr:hypothetical protein [Sulfuricurvum sp.]MDD2781653.1 hypothetical protein [Sulfuricurvum sp.]